MFRNPRENSSRAAANALLPSTGRAPSPQTASAPKGNISPYFGQFATPTPDLVGLLGGLRNQTQAGVDSPTRRAGVTKKAPFKLSNGKPKGSKQNQSILNFFGKAEKKPHTGERSADDDGLFFEDRRASSYDNSTADRPGSSGLFMGQDDDDMDGYLRHNEFESPVKRRKLSEVGLEEGMASTFNAEVSTDIQRGDLGQEPATFSTAVAEKPVVVSGKPVRHLGGFIDESSSDEEDDRTPQPLSTNVRQEGEPRSSAGEGGPITNVDASGTEPSGAPLLTTSSSSPNNGVIHTAVDNYSSLDTPGVATEVENSRELDPDEVELTYDEKLPSRPILIRDSTSLGVDPFEDEDEDYSDGNEFAEYGEEMMERQWMEEQRRLEMEFDEDSKSESEEDAMTPNDPVNQASLAASKDNSSFCPICNASLKGFTESQASSHVNACLDGNPTPLPNLQGSVSKGSTNEAFTAVAAPKRFQRAAIARPGQLNPFSLGKDSTSSGSAFSRLMSGHAEDQAWAAAASNEVTSRGKPAYQRTCPFYKIMPGLFICVDAFRYGKVEGQNAYFLSHFHSDHYIGLTSSWCHGPIYCSKITANLVRQQLRVDPKWVVPLEYEEKVEVPDTYGVFVTMIPANHCPGSSLFLFEKAFDKGPRGPRVSRILHCGDFRACPAHVKHPLLRPDVVDAITGLTKQQTIDTCYLDTTYLTPKYAFPSQEDVITACAQMCVSLSKEIVDSDDSWEKAKLERAGSTMTKFLEKVSTSDSAPVQVDVDNEDFKPVKRGRLLVVCGTYSIGKERICVGIAKALNSKIYAPPSKMKICACLEDRELSALLTPHPLEAQVHMQMLMEIRAETLLDYLQSYKGAFERVVGFRPTGWNYRPPTSRNSENPAVSTVLHSEGWKSRFSMTDLAPQRGSTKESNCFGVPYSEHSSFRELTMFCCALRIGRIIPTVNVGSAKSREKMKFWVEKWDVEKRKNGLFRIEEGQTSW